MPRSRKPGAAASAQLDLPGLAVPPPVIASAGGRPIETDSIIPSLLDAQFARLMGRLAGPDSPPLLETAAARASAWRAAGHSCAPVEPGWRAALLATSVVGPPGAERPLILDAQNRLYLHRYWRYEQALAKSIFARVATPSLPPTSKAIGRQLAEWLPVSEPDRQAGQRAAVQTALSSSLSVITGGPGTGKTRTVAIILALLATLARERGERPPRILLAAPTGKAARRLTESIQGVWRDLQILGLPVPVAATLHRTLGLNPQRATPRWNAAHPLPADAVIVDEASMIDLPMMAKLFAATPASARLILLGDRDQLASVETGHVLGDICAAGMFGPLAAQICELTETFRFAGESGLQKLSAAIRRGEADTARDLLTASNADVLGRSLPTPAEMPARLAERVVEGFRAAVTARTPAAALQALGEFRLLCAVRAGPCGVEHLNHLTETALAQAGLIVPTTRHYRGRVIMIQRNDYGLRLLNGDVGIIRLDEHGELRAFFAGDDGQPRSLAPSRLPEHETAWAMTVHKSQGSEFRRVLLVLPGQESPVVSRELIYTAITRAREGVEVWFDPSLWAAAVARQTIRLGGLRERLQANPVPRS